MGKQWQGGCLRIEIREANGPHPLEDQYAHLYIQAQTDRNEPGELQAEGVLGSQLAHLLYACVILSGGEAEEWFVPNAGHPLHMRRQGHRIEIARFPTYATNASSWLQDDGFYLVDFGLFLESLSAAVEWLMGDLSDDFAEDDMVQILIHQWERAWQRFSRLATGRRVTLMSVVPTPSL